MDDGHPGAARDLGTLRNATNSVEVGGCDRAPDPSSARMTGSPVSYELARCIVCGHTDADVVADADQIRSEVEALWDYHQRRLKPETPPARLVDRVAFSEPPPFRLVKCNECGLLYRNPVERPQELTEIYARSVSAPDVLRALHDTQLPALRVQARELRRELGRGGRGSRSAATSARSSTRRATKNFRFRDSTSTRT